MVAATAAARAVGAFGASRSLSLTRRGEGLLTLCARRLLEALLLGSLLQALLLLEARLLWCLLEARLLRGTRCERAVVLTNRVLTHRIMRCESAVVLTDARRGCVVANEGRRSAERVAARCRDLTIASRSGGEGAALL